MQSLFKNIALKKISYNGTDLKNIYFNGVKVWSGGKIVLTDGGEGVRWFKNAQGVSYGDAAVVDIKDFDLSNLTDYREMFNQLNCTTTFLNTKNMVTSKVKSLKYAFDNDIKLTSLDTSGWDTSNVTTMYETFGSCWSLTSMDLSSFKTSKVTDMSYMFYDCRELSHMVLNFDMSSCNSVYHMFKDVYLQTGSVRFYNVRKSIWPNREQFITELGWGTTSYFGYPPICDTVVVNFI